jgi:hypothetical protein
LTENGAMQVPDARFVSIDLWDCQRPVAVASCACGRDSGAKAANQCAATR